MAFKERLKGAAGSELPDFGKLAWDKMPSLDEVRGWPPCNRCASIDECCAWHLAWMDGRVRALSAHESSQLTHGVLAQAQAQ